MIPKEDLKLKNLSLPPSIPRNVHSCERGKEGEEAFLANQV